MLLGYVHDSYFPAVSDCGSPAAEAAAVALAAHLVVVVLDDEMVPLPTDRVTTPSCNQTNGIAQDSITASVGLNFFSSLLLKDCDSNQMWKLYIKSNRPTILA